MTHSWLYKGEPKTGWVGSAALKSGCRGSPGLFRGYSGGRGAEVAVVHPNRG
jgi:hypothetical protein